MAETNSAEHADEARSAHMDELRNLEGFRMCLVHYNPEAKKWVIQIGLTDAGLAETYNYPTAFGDIPVVYHTHRQTFPLFSEASPS